jgi:competence CoiA-like predicted nuclease
MRMSTKQLNMIFALNNNELVHVSEVPSGLECECFCPACNAKLVAKKGEKTIHHFAHYKSEECKYGYETSLHLAAKQMIAEARKFTIPAVYLNFPSSGKKRLLISEAKEIEISEASLEQREGNIIPDIVILSNNKKIFIEIYVTHAMDM